MIGESDFFVAIQLLSIRKNAYGLDNQMLEQVTNFQIFITMINDPQFANKKPGIINVLNLLFPGYSIIFTPRSILMNSNEVNVIIDEGNFEQLQSLFRTVFCLDKSGQSDTFNPSSKKAQEIANKLMKARQRVAAQKAAEGGEGSTLGQYLSILTVGLGSMSLREMRELTLYQMYDLVERYSLYTQWDLDARCRLAGGKPDKPAENWMKNIH